MPRVVVAPDKFKGSLPASSVAAHLAAGLMAGRPDVEAVCVPVADGGEGTVDAALSAGYDRVPVIASGPTGEPVRTAYARRGTDAVVELAAVNGLALLPPVAAASKVAAAPGSLMSAASSESLGSMRSLGSSGADPLRASSFGTGEVVRAALDAGCRRIVLGIGGSACTDGGAGMLQALGARLLDAQGNDLPPGGAALTWLDALDLNGLHPGLRSAELVVASDVDNPLYGDTGAAAVYGPQKGASPDQVALLDRALRNWASVVARVTGVDDSNGLAGAPGAGAAGGVGFGAVAVLGAVLRPGIDLVLDLVGLDSALRGASLVITGEGSLDRQSLHGKAPAGVARTARRAGVPVLAVSGQSLLSATELGFEAVYALTDLEPDVRRSMAAAGQLLERVGATVAREHLSGNASYRLKGEGVMSEPDLVIRARRLVTPTGSRSGSVCVRDGVIVGIESYDAEPAAARVVTLSDDEVLLPGLVDTHVHVNDPGRSDWEDFGTATRAAAAGGVTTIIDMPLNSIPPTTDIAALAVKRKTASGQAFIDVGFWGGAVPGNLSELRGLHEAGVFGFKCFLLHSGVDEFPHLSPAELRDALRETGSLDALMIVHAEDPATIDHAPAASGRRYRDFLASRPREAENLAVAAVLDLARSTGCRAHLLHLSSSDALPLIRAARRDGVRLTAETCPHYLTFDADEIADGATSFKCCPPIREAENRELLWEGLADGTIDCVVSDHSPSTAELKQLDTGDFGTAWGGIASLQLGLPAVWTEARSRGFGLDDVVRWMASRPADLASLASKGRIAVGSAADLCVFAPDSSFVVDARRLHHKNPVTPYDGRALTGVVRGTWLRGALIDDEPRGRLLSRGAA